MDFFKDNHPEELEQFYQDDKNRKEIEALVKERTRLKKHVRKDDDARKQVRDEITKVHNELEISKSERKNLEDNLKSQTEADLKEIKKDPYHEATLVYSGQNSQGTRS